MKGTFFQKPLEFRLQVDGESWNQGNAISGTLVAKNHGNESVPMDHVRVALAHGLLRHVHAKDPDAFEILNTTSGQAGDKLEAQKEFTLPWKFQTERNTPITDNLSSLFLVYGKGEATEQLGQLQLKMIPDPVIEEFIQIFIISYRFVVKSRKHSKGTVEVKLAPPDAKAFASLEQLIVKFHFEGETVHLAYSFGVKKVEATAASVDMKKAKKEFEQEFKPLQYKTASGRFNHDAVEAEIRQVMAQVESKVLF